MTSDFPFCPSRRAFLDLVASGLAVAALPASRAVAQGSNLTAMKIATIGAGREGGALGTLYAKLGHQVMFSSRHPEELKDLVAAAGPTARAGTVADAVAFGEVIFLVVPYTAVEQIGRDFGPALATKPLVLDVSNPIARRDGQAIVDKVAGEGGAGLVTAKLLKGSRIVRAFNAIGSGALEKNAHRSGEKLGIPIAGDDKGAIALASRLIREAGFEPVLIGGLAKGKYLVPGTPLGGMHTPTELRQIAATLS
ncbi:MAG: NADPH-dependent F420 reductase [Stellaceae bacterium]